MIRGYSDHPSGLLHFKVQRRLRQHQTMPVALKMSITCQRESAGLPSDYRFTWALNRDGKYP